LQELAKQELKVSGNCKALLSHEFRYARETGSSVFPELLNKLDANKYKLIFVPVNQGANYEYVKPLVKDLLVAKEVPENELEQHLIIQNDIPQGNDYDCGIYLLTFTKLLIQYSDLLPKMDLSEIDSQKEREYWQNKEINPSGYLESDKNSVGEQYQNFLKERKTKKIDIELEQRILQSVSDFEKWIGQGFSHEASTWIQNRIKEEEAKGLSIEQVKKQ
ncbi:17508_t:CDS:2, partial [Cetraspora pellucida]